MRAEPWEVRLAAIRQLAARRCGLRHYPAGAIAETEERDRRRVREAYKAPWRERLAQRGTPAADYPGSTRNRHA